MPRGWVKEPVRHALASQGASTRPNINRYLDEYKWKVQPYPIIRFHIKDNTTNEFN